MKNTKIKAVYTDFLGLNEDINAGIKNIEQRGNEVINFQVVTDEDSGSMKCLIMYQEMRFRN